MEHKFDIQDLKWICQNYSSLSNKDQILNLIIKHIKRVIDSNYNCEFDLIIDVLKSPVLGFDYKVKMFNMSLEGIKENELYALLSAFGFDSLVQSLQGDNVKVKVNPENQNILALLVTRNIIQPCTTTPSGKYYHRLKFSEKND